MSLNEVLPYNPRKTGERPVPSGTLSGAPLLIGTRPCVTITARSDASKTFTLADGSSRTIPIGSAGQTAGNATVAFDGTWDLPVAGVTTSTAQDTPVYITSGNALNLTSTGNTLFGYINYPTGYTQKNGVAPVRIAQVN